MADRQLLLLKLLSRERKADFESGLSSLLINEEITGTENGSIEVLWLSIVLISS